MNNIESAKGEIVMYQPDETIRLEVRVEDETVWLTQQQMAELFLTTKQNVSLHVNNIFREDELTESSVVKESLTTAKDGKRYIADPVETVKAGKGEYYDIPIDYYMKEQGTIWLYDPYGEYGNQLFFEGFLNHPIETLKGG